MNASFLYLIFFLVEELLINKIREEPLVSIIVPLYNEEDTIGDVLERLERLATIRKEIIVVDDGSRDNSLTASKQFPFVTILNHKERRGKGAAIQTGFAHGKGDIFVVQDADLEYSPEEIPKIVHPIIERKADVVYGSRFKEIRAEDMKFSHRLGNRILSIASTLLYGKLVTDVMTGHKCFRRNVIEALHLSENGFKIEVEITAQVLRRDFRFTEVPITYHYRKHSHSKIRSSDGLECLWKLLKARFQCNS